MSRTRKAVFFTLLLLGVAISPGGKAAGDKIRTLQDIQPEMRSTTDHLQSRLWPRDRICTNLDYLACMNVDVHGCYELIEEPPFRECWLLYQSTFGDVSSAEHTAGQFLSCMRKVLNETVFNDGIFSQCVAGKTARRHSSSSAHGVVQWINQSPIVPESLFVERDARLIGAVLSGNVSDVWAFRSGKMKRKLKNCDGIYEGDAIVSGYDSRIRVRFEEGNREPALYLMDNTSLYFEAYRYDASKSRGVMSLRLNRGLVHFPGSHSTGTIQFSFLINTPGARVSIGAGGSAAILVSTRGQTTVFSTGGAVTVRGLADDINQMLGEEKGVLVSEGGEITPLLLSSAHGKALRPVFRMRSPAAGLGCGDWIEPGAGSGRSR